MFAKVIPLGVCRQRRKYKGLVQTPETIAKLIERALRTREAELCSSQLTRLGFVLDVIAPNLAAKLVEWQARWQDRKP